MIRGVDLSSYQTHVDFAALKAADIAFVFTKLGEGQTIFDPTYVRNVTECKKNGILVGPYAFVRPMPSSYPRTEARIHWGLSRNAPECDLPLVMDLESPPNPDQKSWVAEWALSYLDEAAQLWNRRPLLYSYPYFLEQLKAPSLAAYDLWIASYNTASWPDDNDKPLVPEPWTTWQFWQWTDKYKFGIMSVDGDVFNGTLDDLKSYAAGDPSVVTSDPAAGSTTADA